MQIYMCYIIHLAYLMQMIPKYKIHSAGSLQLKCTVQLNIIVLSQEEHNDVTQSRLN